MLKRESELKRQQGAVLIVSLIMLVLATGIAVSSFNLGRGGVQIVANTELDLQTFAAAQAALEETINTDEIFRGRSAFFCGEQANRRCFETIDGRIEVDLDPPPNCLRVKLLKNSELDATNEVDRGCFLGAVQQGAIDGGNRGGPSLCSNLVWDIRAVARYIQHGEQDAQVRLRQGIGVRSSATNAENQCSENSTALPE